MDLETMQTETVDTAADTEVTTEVDLSAFDDGWDSDGYTAPSEDAEEEADEVTNEEAEADQQEAENVEALDAKEEPAQENEESAAAADQLYKLKHYSGDREVTLDEALVLAQKGIDRDIKIPKLNAKIAEYEEFLNELASPGGLTIEQLMDSTRARMLQNKKAAEGEEISETDALFQVQSARAGKAQAEKQNNEPEPEKGAESTIPDAVKQFTQAYPNVKAEEIPQSVWDEVRRTGDLLGAYTRYENAELKKRVSALETNKKNENRSTGSRKSAGTSKVRDAFDDGWDSI